MVASTENGSSTAARAVERVVVSTRNACAWGTPSLPSAQREKPPLRAVYVYEVFVSLTSVDEYRSHEPFRYR